MGATGLRGDVEATVVTEVLVAQRWKDNAELIQAVFEMHVYPTFIGRQVQVLDPTWGRGTWWNWQSSAVPTRAVTGFDRKTDPEFDFRKMDFIPDNSFDVVAFDPDYVAPGGRKTSTIGEFNDRYGLKDEYETPASLQQSINEGLTECARVVRPQGLILVKCMNYISSGRPVVGEYEVMKHAETLGLKVHDIFRPIFDPGPQPKDRKCGKCRGEGGGVVVNQWGEPENEDCEFCEGTGRLTPRQQHARANSSTLIIFRKPGRRTK
jgi:hypothetical protein